MPKPISNVQQLSAVSGVDESSLEQLTPAEQQLLFDKPYLAKGFVDKTYSLVDGKVNVNDSYKNGELYQRLSNLKPGTVIDNDTLHQMFQSISTYSYLNHGEAPRVTFMPKIVVGNDPGQVSNQALMTFMDKMVTGLANGDLPRISMDLEAQMDTGLGRIVEGSMDRETFVAMAKYIPFLSKPAIGYTTQNWIQAIYKIAGNNPTAGPEMTFDSNGNVVHAVPVSEEDFKKSANISDKDFSDIVENIKRKKAQGMSASEAKQEALFDDKGHDIFGGKTNFDADGNAINVFTKGLLSSVPLALLKSGYGKEMFQNADTKKFGFRNEVDANIDGSNIVAKSLDGSGQLIIPTTSASKTLLDRIQLGNAFSGSPAFKSIGKKIAGRNYIIGDMSGDSGLSSVNEEDVNDAVRDNGSLLQK